jgi:[ribosomal protein S5]-alanine N-acetyltransferase
MNAASLTIQLICSAKFKQAVMKIIIRPWKKEDIHLLAAIANNINVWNNVRDRLPHPYTEKDAEAWINFTLSQNPLTHFAIEADDVPVGSIGFLLKDDVYKKNIEIGYFLGEPYWGKGIATEAVKQLVALLVADYDVIRIYAAVFENNKGSMRVLEKNGFELEAIHRKSVFKNNVLLDEYVWAKLI